MTDRAMVVVLVNRLFGRPRSYGRLPAPTAPRARALVDEIDATFDLADEVSTHFPTVVKMTILSFIFIVVWLLLLSSGIVWLVLAGPTLQTIVNIAVQSALIAIGAVTLILLIQVFRFFRFFVINHRIVTDIDDLGTTKDPTSAPAGGTKQRHAKGTDDGAGSFVGFLSDLEPTETLAAVFALNARLNGYVPQVKRLVRLGSLLVSLLMAFGVLDLILIAVVPHQPSFLWWAVMPIGVGLVLDLPLLAIGVGAMLQMRRTNRFFGWFVVRWSAIERLRNRDSAIPVPEGADPVTRYLTYLGSASVLFGDSLDRADHGQHSRQSQLSRQSQHGQHSQRRSEAVDLAGRSGATHSFDAVLGGGERARPVLLLRHFPAAPTTEDLDRFETAAKDVLWKLEGSLVKLVLLWSMAPETDEFANGLTDEVYDTILSHSFQVELGARPYACIFELVIEQRDDTYDFIPFIAEV